MQNSCDSAVSTCLYLGLTALSSLNTIIEQRPHLTNESGPMESRPLELRHIRTCWQGRISCALVAIMFAVAAAPAIADDAHVVDRSKYGAPKASIAPAIDGIAEESVWNRAAWQELNHRWLGPEYTADDFQGRYKIVWNGTKIYVLAEIVDDTLIDTHRDPLTQYWDDDCLEIFIDEDFSGGDHQFNHNAFAYHVSLDNQTIDIGTNMQAQNYSHHVESRWQQQDGKVIWELAIDIYTDEFVDGSDENTPATLSAGKLMGLMIAYCDNDGSELRENFIGSESVPEGPKDRGWIDAGLFGALELKE